jgi:hypothetical protein
MVNNKLEKVELTMEEIWAHTKPKVHKNKKKYNRKKEKAVLRKDRLF